MKKIAEITAMSLVLVTLKESHHYATILTERTKCFFYGARDTNSLIPDSIFSINLKSHIGKPVDSLLKYFPKSPNSFWISSADNPRLASRLIVTYDNWYWIQIVVTSFKHMAQYDSNRIWLLKSISLLTNSLFTVYHHGTVYFLII